MKRRGIKLTILALSMTMAMGILGGCSSKDSSDKGNSNLKGSITLSGSSALLPLIEASKENFEEENSGVTINAQAGGSGTGLTQVSQGAVDVGNSDVFAEEKLSADQAKALVDHKVVAQGFAVVVNKGLGITSLTPKQIQDIFSGTVKNWKEVGGSDKEITVVHRPSSSGTRATFTKTLLGEKKELENDQIGVTQESNGAVVKAMETAEGAISYVGLSYLSSDEAKDKLVAMKIDNVEASIDNITAGKYPFWAWGHMYTKGEPNEISKAFIEYITSDANKEIVSKQGYISGSDMKVK